MTLTDTTIHDNSAPRYGGGILALAANVTLTGSSDLSANHSGYWGGGAYVGGSLVVSGDATIHDNSAGLAGGGVYANYLTLDGNAKIYDNSAGSHGGGIYGSYASRLANCIAGTEGDEGVNVFNNTPDDIYTQSP